MNNQKTWLITGAAGFIGSHLLHHLLKNDHKVIGLDNFLSGYAHNIDAALENLNEKQKSQFTFIEGDIRDLSICLDITDGVDIILHQAALVSVPVSIEDPLTCHDINVTGFHNLLFAAKENHVKRVVYASSSAVYGNNPTLPKKESMLPEPLSPYATSKLINEKDAALFANCYGLETIGLRYFNVYGARQDPTGGYAAVISAWIDALKNNKPIAIYGDGKTSRDFCHVSDVVNANIKAALTENKAAINQVYNVGTGNETSLNTLSNTLIELSKNPSLKPTYKDFRKGDVKHSVADIALIKEQLQFTATMNLKDGLKTLLKKPFSMLI